MNDLRQIAWMRRQWRRFLLLLWGATALLWPLCLSGALFLGPEAVPVRLALLAMLALTTGACVRFSREACRRLAELEHQAAAARAHSVLKEQKAARRPGAPPPDLS